MYTVTHISTSAPTVNDDFDSGYLQGQFWWNSTTLKLYFCDDDTGGAAVWNDVTASSVDKWKDWTPSYVWTGNTPTGITDVALYTTIGNTVFFTLDIDATTGGIGNLTDMTFTLPTIASIVDNNSQIPITSMRWVNGVGWSNADICSIDSEINDPPIGAYNSFTSIAAGTDFQLYFAGFYETS